MWYISSFFELWGNYCHVVRGWVGRMTTLGQKLGWSFPLWFSEIDRHLGRLHIGRATEVWLRGGCCPLWTPCLSSIGGTDAVFNLCSLYSDKRELPGSVSECWGDSLQPESFPHYWYALGKGMAWWDWGGLLMVLNWNSFKAVDHESRSLLSRHSRTNSVLICG